MGGFVHTIPVQAMVRILLLPALSAVLTMTAGSG